MARTPIQKDDLVHTLISDHRNAEEAFREYEQGDLSADQRKQLVDHIITELVRHSVAEEQYLYPAAREKLSDGSAVADEEISEHAEAEQVMKQLEGLSSQEAEFDRLTRKLIADIRHHVDEEEHDLFPRLQRACTAEQLMDLGNKINMAKDSAPTRPHPSVPDRPPANTVLDPGVGMIDRLRDALSGRRKEA